jgi:hypothetical protein
MKILLTLIIIIFILLAVWILWSAFADQNLESPQYTVTEQKDGYEIRAYDAYISAETVVSKNTNSPQNKAFMELAGYIFGGNTAQEKIAMTVPVATQETTSEKIAMTKPVTTQEEGDQMTMSFMMPAHLTLETLPIPDSKKITFKEVPKGVFAVSTFTGYVSQSKTVSKIQQLQTMLQRDGVSVMGAAELLQYDQPLKFPWLRRNEIKIEIDA